jgi:SulP family sulfate permease
MKLLVYYHCLYYRVGGIGIFIAKTGLEVTANTSFSLTIQGWSTFLEKLHLLAVVFVFEAGLRIISHLTRDESGKSRYPLLSPIYFCAIPPFFYACTAIWRFVSGNSVGGEYFFPPLTNSNDDHASDVWEIFQIIDIRSVSWVAVLRCIPTMIALVLFSLIHVPINIPAFAVSSNVEVNMNVELMAHGYSIFFAGVLGGAFNHGLTVS